MTSAPSARGCGGSTSPYVAAVAALPDHVAVPGEHQAALHIGQQLAVALLVLLLDLGHFLKQEGDVVEALLLGLLGHGGIHVGPLVVLALSSGLQVLSSGADATQQLEPDLGVLFLVGGGLLKDLGDLHIAVLLGLGGEVGVLIAGLGLSGKGGPQVLFGLAALQFRHRKFLPKSMYCYFLTRIILIS